VDRTPFNTAWTAEGQVSEIALRQAAGLRREASQQGVVLSIENGGQTIAAITLLVRMVRNKLPKDEGRFLGICADPANQFPRYPNSDPVAEIEPIPPDFLKIVQFKQTLDGKPHPVIDLGDVDCLRQMRVLKRIVYRGAIVMEIPPHDNVMENLSVSFAYLKKEIKKSN
jgi:sugar phosphate isomerase/epimerase